MVKILLKKELIQSIYDLKFLLIILTCITITPLSIYLGVKDYKNAKLNYEKELQNYISNSKNINYDFNAFLYRKIEPSSVFSYSLRDCLPYNAIINNTGYNINYKIQNSNRFSFIFGKLDFLFIVTFVFSIFCLILTCNSIASEKENNTLMLILSNPVSKSKLFLSKLISNTLLIICLFTFSIFIGLLLIQLIGGGIDIFQKDFLLDFVYIYFCSIIFFIFNLSLGLVISTITSSTSKSTTFALTAWIILTLLIPKLCPFIAKSIQTTKSFNVLTLEKEHLISDYEKKINTLERNVYFELLNKYDYSEDVVIRNDFNSEEFEPFREEYLNKIQGQKDILKTNLENKIYKLQQDYSRNVLKRRKLQRGLLRLSPSGCINNIITEFSNSSYSEIENFENSVINFQFEVNEKVFNNYKIVNFPNSRKIIPQAKVDEVPLYEYKPAIIKEKVIAISYDFIFLIMHTLIFLLLSFKLFKINQ